MKQEANGLGHGARGNSTSGPHELRSGSALLASATPEQEQAFLESLDDNALAALPWIFEFWALPHQLPPAGDWRTWVVLGGRGAGKTRAGAEWVRSMVEGETPEALGRARRVALVGETYDQALAVMVKGESGLIACSPPDRVPRWVAGERMLIWPNGTEARLYSAHDPEALRGPQFDLAWCDEFGCAAIDKGTNQPNTFLDPKSAESRLPYYSNGRRDDLIQAQYLRAVTDYWSEEGRNPRSDQYDGPMLDIGRAHAWAWDARPWPAFPNDLDRWSDGGNWARGHWLTGRLDAQPLEHVVAEICERAGLKHYDVSALHGLVRGHVSAQTETARARLQSLMMAYGFQAVERDGKLVFLPSPDVPSKVIAAPETARDDDGEGGFTRTRAPEAETVGRLRIGFVDAEGSYGDKVAEAVFPGDGADQVNDVDLPLALTRAEGQGMAERWLAEGRVAQDTLRFALPPSDRALGAGALVATEDGHTWRVDRVEDRGYRQIEASRVEPSTAIPSDEVEEVVRVEPFVPPLPVTPVFLDLPLLTGDEVEHAPHLAVAASPWPGSAAVYSAPGSDGFTLNKIIEKPAILGTLQTPLFRQTSGLWDRSGDLRVELETGALSSAEMSAVLAGANAAAIGSGDDDLWEVIQFADATLVGPGTWDIGLRLRGQLGTAGVMPDVWPEGSVFVLLDAAVTQVDLPSSARGLVRTWRVGPSRRAVDDPSYTEETVAFQGIGLRPYSPVHLRAPRVGNAREVSWIRRSRIDADSWDGPDVPLGEASEHYILRVVDSIATRREVILSAPAFTYTDAMRAADGTLSDYFIDVAQVSERFGAGPFARTEIND